MLDLLDKARELPEECRRLIAILISLGITFLIVVVWVVTITNSRQPDRETAEVSPLESAGSVFSAFSGIVTEANPFK